MSPVNRSQAASRRLGRSVLACAALAASCAEAPSPSPQAVWREAQDALREDRPDGVLTRFSERGRDRLAVLCLLEALEDAVRLPAAATFVELGRLLGQEIADPWPGDESERPAVLQRHGLDEAALAPILAALAAAADEHPAREVEERALATVQAAIDGLPDRDALLRELLPLSEVKTLREGSFWDVERRGDSATLTVSVRERIRDARDAAPRNEPSRETLAEVPLVRVESRWKIDALPGR